MTAQERRLWRKKKKPMDDVIDFEEAKKNRIASAVADRMEEEAVSDDDECWNQSISGDVEYYASKYKAFAKELVAILERSIDFGTLSEIIGVVEHFGWLTAEHKIILQGIVDTRKLVEKGKRFTAMEIVKVKRKGTVGKMETKDIIKEHPDFTPRIIDAIMFGWYPEYLDPDEYDQACLEEFGTDEDE